MYCIYFKDCAHGCTSYRPLCGNGILHCWQFILGSVVQCMNNMKSNFERYATSLRSIICQWIISVTALLQLHFCCVMQFEAREFLKIGPVGVFKNTQTFIQLQVWVAISNPSDVRKDHFFFPHHLCLVIVCILGFIFWHYGFARSPFDVKTSLNAPSKLHIWYVVHGLKYTTKIVRFCN